MLYYVVFIASFAMLWAYRHQMLPQSDFRFKHPMFSDGQEAENEDKDIAFKGHSTAIYGFESNRRDGNVNPHASSA
jgi:hypothetical protein